MDLIRFQAQPLAAAQKDAARDAARQRYNAEKARQASIAAANQRAQEDAQEKIRIQASIRTAEKKEATRQANIAATNKRAQEAAQEKIRIQASIRTAEKAETVRLAEAASNSKKVEAASASLAVVTAVSKAKEVAETLPAFTSPTGTSRYAHLMPDSANGAGKVFNTVSSKLGAVGAVFNVASGAHKEIASLGEDATKAETMTAGILGSVKELDNVAVSLFGGSLAGVVGGFSGLGVATVVTAPAAAMAGAYALNEGYVASGTDAMVNGAVDRTKPYLLEVVKVGLDVAGSVDGAVDYVQSIVSKNSPQSLLVNSN